jgi:hypothetical protein
MGLGQADALCGVAVMVGFPGALIGECPGQVGERDILESPESQPIACGWRGKRISSNILLSTQFK